MIHAIDVAATQVGIAEETGNNDGIPAERYMRGDKLAWCAGFVLYCYAHSDDDNIEKRESEWWKFRKVSTMLDAMRMRGVVLPRGLVPTRNDLIFYGNRAGSDKGRGTHVGIVERVVVEKRDAKFAANVHTIEGNLSDKVCRRVVSLDDKSVVAFARPARYTPHHLA